MGTHPIFESDFDCLTEKMYLKFYLNDDGKRVYTLKNVTPKENQLSRPILPDSAPMTSSAKSVSPSRSVSAFCQLNRPPSPSRAESLVTSMGHTVWSILYGHSGQIRLTLRTD